MKSVEDQIREIDGNYQTFKTSNKVMESNMVKLEQSLNEVSREENSLQSQLDENLSSMEQKVQDQNKLVQQKVQDLENTQKEYKKLNNKAETMKNKIDISQSIQSFHESSNCKMKINNLQNEIKKSTEKGDRLESEIENQKKRWNDMYDQTVDDLKMRIGETNSQRSLQQI